MRYSGSHQFPGMDKVIFGKPHPTVILEEAERLGARRVFLVVSRSLNTRTDEIEKVRKALGKRYAATFDGVAQHTTRRQAVEAASLALQAQADLVVAIGGGSVIDLAKIILMCVEHEIIDEHGLDGFELVSTPSGPRPGPFRDPKARVIAVPSTLSGGDYSASSLVTDERRGLKQIFFHRMMMPLTVILDPDLTRFTPDDLWNGSGTRAMDHAIEAICSPAGNPLVDEVCTAGLTYLRDGLLQVKDDPDDRDARHLCQVGSWLCSFGHQSRVPMGASHAIGHVLGGTCGVPHYLCTSVLLPSVLRYNLPATELPQKRIAGALRSPLIPAADAFAALVRRIGLPGRLADVGVTESQYGLIGENAMLSVFTRSNPRPIKTPQDVAEILRLAA
jgi:maleylacetate reductase